MLQRPCQAPPVGRALRILLGLVLIVYVTPVYFQVPVRIAVGSLLLTLGLIGVYSLIDVVVSRRIVGFGPSLGAVVAAGLVVALYVAGASGAPILGHGKGELATVTFLGISLVVAGVRAAPGCELMAIPGMLFGKHTELACLIFSPLDKLERRLRNKPVRKVFAAALPLLFLAAPSLWLMVFVPPLWRDVDAYVQAVSPPNASTILLHGPLYCTLCRVPLWFGYLISGAGPAVRLGYFIKHTQLTDNGVFVLLFLQHVALWCAALYFINAITATLSARLLIAVFFGSHPLFYTFAHCIGSETLSMIIMIFLAGAGLRIVLRYPDIRMRDWILFGALLCSGILTRHLNCALAALLPITIFLIALSESLRIFVVQRRTRPSVRFEFGKPARVCGISIATGLSALILATSVTHLLCWRAHIHWQPKFGFTFLWRLNFLERVPTASRDGFLSATASQCQLPETRQLLAMLANWFGQNKPWNPPRFVNEAGAALFSSAGKLQDEMDAKFDRSLNEMAFAFLCPPSAALRSAALDDFQYATRLREADVAHYLFVTTDFFFTHRNDLPQCAQLKTFRAPRTELIDASNRFYFQWWNPISFRMWSVIGLVVLLVTLFMNIKFQITAGPVILYAVTLSTLGVIMVLLNCFFAQIQPRFSLPMMEFLLLSIMILLGLIFRSYISVSRRESSRTAREK